MKLFELIKRFHNDESGAVTVDWVVLTAAIVGLGVAVLATVGTGVQNMAADIESSLTTGDVVAVDTLGFASDGTGNGN